MPGSTSRVSKSVWVLLALSVMVFIAFLWFGQPTGERPEPGVAVAENADGLSATEQGAAAKRAARRAASNRVTNSTPADASDAEPQGRLQLTVLDAQGRPLPDAQVSAKTRDSGPKSVTKNLVTDNTGMALVRYPDSGFQTLEVSADHVDYSGRKVLWDLKSGDTIPASYTLKLSAEVTIGGIVIDTAENPISGAEI